MSAPYTTELCISLLSLSASWSSPAHVFASFLLDVAFRYILSVTDATVFKYWLSIQKYPSKLIVLATDLVGSRGVMSVLVPYVRYGVLGFLIVIAEAHICN